MGFSRRNPGWPGNATYLISAALGWNIVPRTIIRDGPADRHAPAVGRPTGRRRHGSGGPVPGPRIAGLGYLAVLQAYDYAGDEGGADPPTIPRCAGWRCSTLVNNADRKGGCAARPDGGVFGVDHGLRLHTEDKLRTVLWGWAGKPVDDETGRGPGTSAALDGELGAQLRRTCHGAGGAGPVRAGAELLGDPVMPDRPPPADSVASALISIHRIRLCGSDASPPRTAGERCGDRLMTIVTAPANRGNRAETMNRHLIPVRVRIRSNHKMHIFTEQVGATHVTSTSQHPPRRARVHRRRSRPVRPTAIVDGVDDRQRDLRPAVPDGAAPPGPR